VARPRKNNANYFSHDAGMRSDGRILVLRKKYGNEGYACFCMTLELLTAANNFQKQIDEIELEVIAADFHIDSKYLKEIWKEAHHLKLLNFTEGLLICPNLIKRMEPLLIERQRQREKSQKRWNPTANRKKDNCNTAVLPQYYHGITAEKSCKGKERKGKNINISFDEFWNLYDKKRGYKEKIEKKWNSLTNEEREAIITYIPKYKSCQPDKKFRKDPLSFLNNKSWNDELIPGGNPEKKSNTLQSWTEKTPVAI